MHELWISHEARAFLGWGTAFYLAYPKAQILGSWLGWAYSYDQHKHDSGYLLLWRQ